MTVCSELGEMCWRLERMIGGATGEGDRGCIMQDLVVQGKDFSVLSVKTAHKDLNS